MNDKRNCHGAVGKSSSEQHFRKSNAITIAVLNFWSRTPSATRSYGRQAGRRAGRQAGRQAGQNNRLFTLFNKCTALLQLCQCV